MQVRARSAFLAAAAFAALADAAVVVLALPGILADLDTTVYGVAAVIALYTAGVAVAIPLAYVYLARTQRPTRAASAACALFGVGAIVCATSQSITMLLIGRALQAAGAGVVLLVAFEDLQLSAKGRRVWAVLALVALSAGPAIGGVLAELLGWRAIFVAQAPIGLAAGVLIALARPRATYRVQADSPRPETDDSRQRLTAGAALLLLSGSLTAVLFLVILLLVAGWAVSPLTAALAVTVLPAAAVVGARFGGEPHRRAVVGATLVAAGTAPLALLPTASIGWVIAPQVLAGLGMGCATRALAGGLLPEVTMRDAGRLLTLRHTGITLALVALAPVVAHGLSSATRQAKLEGTALVLDAQISPAHKLDMAPGLVLTVRDQQPRTALRRATPRALALVAPDERAAARDVVARADQVLVRAVGTAFRSAFLIAAGFALVAATLLALEFGEHKALILGSLVAVVATTGQLLAHHRWAPAPVAIADPCTAQAPPSSGGISGVLQREALSALNRAACGFHSSREELVLALADPAEADRFAEKYGTNPRSAGGLLNALLGG